MPDYRTTCRAHSTFHTRSNIWRKVRTPGNRLSTLKVVRKPLATKCAHSGVRLNGIKRAEGRTMSRNERTISRAYGGALSMQTVRDKILRAFLCEESKAAKMEAKKKATKTVTKK
ncbi:Ribosomal_protein L34 [Hexamita inflata]|uniref:Ribosomal protein L34 n=1 Tax=Hexamita inflata TaxID=28002 RepID=A0AA86TVT7_9EUKA|nr:Ribosomal protein L34 [Hexamita inflata]